MRALKNMKFSVFMLVLLLTGSYTVQAQEQENKEQECNIKYNLFRVDAKNGNYDLAYDNWFWTFENCPDLSVNIYKVGIEIAEYKYSQATTDAEKNTAIALLEKVYDQRLQYYPDDKPARLYSDLAMFLHDAGQDEAKIYNLFDKAYKTNASDMGIVAIPLYYKGIIDRNKETNVQFIFDMYDNLNDVINEKMDIYSKKLDEYQSIEENGTELSDKQERYKNAYSVNLEGLGQAAAVITDMSEEFATCDRLIPLYESEFESQKTNTTWLRRSAGRLQDKGCTDSDLYDKIVETYINVDPSSGAYVAYAGLQMKKGDENKALEYFKKAVDIESDAYTKANILYNIAVLMKNKGRLSESRSYANRALEARPSLGKAYLLIAQMYAQSANACGNGDVFATRMVFQAALIKASRAKSVDPGISATANRYINNYSVKAPSKEDVFVKGLTPGSSWKINCWIGETVRVP